MANYGVPAGYESEPNDEDDFFIGRSYDNGTLSRNETQEPSAGVKKPQKIAINNSHIKRKNSQESQCLENLRLASMKGNLEVIKNVVQKGTPVDSVLKRNWTALMYACSCCHVEVVRYLLECGADPNFHKDSFTPLMALCCSKHEVEEDIVLCVDFLVAAGAAIDAAEVHKVTPLMFATKGGRVDVVKRLVELGVDVNVKDKHGWTALTWAEKSGQTAVAQILLEADPNQTTTCVNGDSGADDVPSPEAHPPPSVELLHGVFTAKPRPERSSPASRPSFQKVVSCLPEIDDEPLVSKRNIDGEQPKDNQKHYVKFGDLEMFLAGLELRSLLHLFEENSIDFHEFLNITDDELVKMGITSVGHRKKILDGIGEVHKKPWEKSSLPAVHNKKQISCPEANVVVENIAKHITYIQATITYLRKHLHSKNLELGKEVTSLSTLTNQTETALVSVTKLENELRNMKNHLDKFAKRIEHLPADHIEKKIKPVTTSCCAWFSLKSTALIAGAAVVGWVYFKPSSLQKFVLTKQGL